MKKKNRVKKAEEFQVLINKGKKVANNSFVLFTMPKKEEEARVGISISKKFGHAVDRNLAKRQVRMMCRECIDFKNSAQDYILIIRLGYRNHSYEINKNNLEKLLLKSTMM